MRNETITLIGWVFFVFSAFSFITSSYRSGDTVGLVGSIFFLVGCMVFLIPFFRRGPE